LQNVLKQVYSDFKDKAHSENKQLMSVELRQIMNLLHHEILHHQLQVEEGAGTKGPNPCWYPQLFGRQDETACTGSK
jgi:hypothetical protein